MNNKKGFTLVELIVSFALITAVSMAFFRTVLVLQQSQLKNIARNSYKAFTVALNNTIQKDFLSDNIEKIISCGDNCYDITYTTNGVVRLSIDKENNTIIYGNIKEKLPKDYKFVNNIEFSSYINSYEGNDSYVALNLNIKSNYEKKIENIKYVYQYDSDKSIIELDVDGAEASDVIEYLLYSSPEENGLYEPLLPDGTSTGIRYRGENPNNYVYFNCEDTYSGVSYGSEGYDYKNACEVWRIIGVFDVDNGKGNIEKRVKLINLNSTFSASWDSSASDVNSGQGINQWGPSTYEDGTTYEGADLMRLLNGYYIGEVVSCKYCNDSNQEVCENDCSISVTPLSSTSLSMIDNALWNLASTTYNTTISLVDMYRGERGTQDGKILCTTLHGASFFACNDKVIRTVVWMGKVGLIYPSDYGYASATEGCSSDIIGNDSACKNNNWLHPSTGYYWLISPRSHRDFADGILWISYNDSVYFAGGYGTPIIHPSLYLKSNVTFIGEGNGTEESPYILGINE